MLSTLVHIRRTTLATQCFAYSRLQRILKCELHRYDRPSCTRCKDNLVRNDETAGSTISHLDKQCIC